MTKILTEEQLDSVLGSGSVNPATGLENENGDVNKELSIEQVDAIMKAPNESAGYLGGGSFGLDPEKFDFQLVAGGDNLEYRAASQSAAGMIAKGTGRLVGSAITKTLAGLGYVGSSIPALVQGDMNMMLDNSWSETFNSLEEGLKESMPIYKTQKYLDGNVFEQMGTLGFWTDDVVDGAAFMLSSIIGAKGMSELGGKIGAYGKLARGFSKLTKAAKLGKDVGKLPANLQKFVQAADMATISTINTVNEAAFEAKDIKDSLMQSFQREINAGRMTQDEANLKASKAAKTTFWTNMAILSPSNLLETSMLFKNAKKLGLNRIIKEGKLAGKTGAEIVKDIPEELTRKQMAGIFAKDALMASISEGAYEENMQTALQNFETAKAQGKEENVPLIKGLARNWMENFTTDEGQKSIAMGAIIGLIPGGIGGVREAKATQAAHHTQAAAIANYLTMSKANALDLFKRTPIRDEKTGEVTGYSDNIELDENGDSVVDKEKLAGIFEGSKQGYIRFIEGMKALASGNQDVYDTVAHDTFSDYAFKVLSSGGDLDVLTTLSDEYAESEIVNLKEAGFITDENEKDFDYIQEAKDKYRNISKELNDIYESVNNNYGGLANFGKTEHAFTFKNKLIYDQFQEASTQVFLNEKAKELEAKVRKGRSAGKGTIEGVKGLKRVESANTIAEGKDAEKQLKNVNNLIDKSEYKMTQLLSFKKQQELFKEEVEALKKLEEGRNKAEDDDSIATKAITNKQDEAVSVKISLDLSINKLTTADAEKHGFKEDSDRSALVNEGTGNEGPSYFYKENDKDGSVQIIYTDGTEEGNIINERYLIGREVVNPVTSDKGRVSLNFMNSKLERAYTFNFETGEKTYHDVSKVEKSLGRSAEPKDASQIYYNILPQVSGWEYTDDPVSTIKADHTDALGEVEISQKHLNQHRNDVKQELADNIAEVRERIMIVIQNYLIN